MKAAVVRVSTSNLAEVLYLLETCHHRIVAVGQQSTWPYGIEELCVTLEGEGIDLDHQNFIRHGSVNLQHLPTAFAAIMATVDAQACEAHS